MYKDDLPEEYAFDMEIQLGDINTMRKVLAVTNRTVFPNLFGCERSISTLRFIKNDSRSTMTERLNGLALMYVHRNLTE